MAAPRMSRTAFQQCFRVINNSIRSSKKTGPIAGIQKQCMHQLKGDFTTLAINQHKVTSKSCSAYLPVLGQSLHGKSKMVFQARYAQMVASSMLLTSKTSTVSIEGGSGEHEVLESSEDGDEVCSQGRKTWRSGFTNYNDG